VCVCVRVCVGHIAGMPIASACVSVGVRACVCACVFACVCVYIGHIAG